MPRLKYFNQTTQQWEYAVVGGQGPQGEIGVGLPTGGLAGMILSKQSSDDYDIEWIIPPSGGGGSITTSDTKPLFPNDGDLWYDTADGLAYVYYDDGVGTLTTRTNLVTNPSFETDITGWVQILDTAEQSSTYSFAGTKSLKINTIQDGDGVYFPNIPVTAGEVYTVSAYIYTDTSKSVNIAVTGGDSTVTIPAGVWTRISASSTIPEFTTTASVFITSFSDDTIPFYIDAVMLEQSSTLNEYFDGSTAGASWTGTAHASTSTLSVSSGNSAQWVELKSSASVSSEVDVRLSNAEADIDDLETANSSVREISLGGTGASTLSGAQANLGIVLSHNYIINGAFDIWQRGIGPTTGDVYVADRWKAQIASQTVQRSTDTPVGFKYSAIISRSAGTINYIVQKIESDTSALLVGKTITVSFWAKNAGTDESLEAQLYYADSTDNFTTTTIFGSPVVVTSSFETSWTRYSATFENLSSSIANGIQLQIVGKTVASTDGHSFYLTGVQLEEGTVATPFRRNQPNIQAELAACQRYYYRRTSKGANAYPLPMGFYNTTTQLIIPVIHPVEMRVPATMSYSNISDFDIEPFDLVPSAINIPAQDANNNNTYSVEIAVTDSTARVRGDAGILAIDIDGGWVAFDAEL
jgi:hypothetical protein